MFHHCGRGWGARGWGALQSGQVVAWLVSLHVASHAVQHCSQNVLPWPQLRGAPGFVSASKQMAQFSGILVALLKELGQIDKPVLLKRGFGATVAEFLGAAAERLLTRPS